MKNTSLDRDSNSWLSRNKEVVSVVALFVTVLVGFNTYCNNQITLANHEHDDKIANITSELTAERAKLANAEALQQTILKECLDVVGAKEAKIQAQLYGSFLNAKIREGDPRFKKVVK
jgi:hypothetical protein